MDAVATRRCNRCPKGVVKPLTEEFFPRNSDGFSYWCKTCDNKRRRELHDQRMVKKTSVGIQQDEAMRRAKQMANGDKELIEIYYREQLREVMIDHFVHTSDIWQPEVGGPVYVNGMKISIAGVQGRRLWYFQRHCRKEDEEWFEAQDSQKHLRRFAVNRIRPYKR